ncbi:DUF1501 domain-containing protein [Singulisphaera sp. PoT]|uniref:DUF1501 domain-containing protein n=1 Tax=Singulisphaera sp. PoT TaxID=3411797 RepID=UPI003BF4CBED
MDVDLRRRITRREAIQRAGTGFGMFGLAALLGAQQQAGANTPAAALNPMSPRPPHFAPKVKRVIHIYLNGGPSQVDTFDPKPMLTKYDGKPLPQGNLTTEQRTGAAFGSPFKFRNYGESGIPVSELFERTGAHADDLCIIRSMHANTPNHEQSMRLMNCGDERLSRPSMGAWLTYGLGSENENLPGYVSMCPGFPVADVSNWRSAFLPGVYQGTYIDTRKEKADELIENIRNSYVSSREQRRQLDLLSEMNRRHLQGRAEDDALDARIASFELAYRMQMEASDAFDVSKEPQHIRDMYGPGVQARQLLIARRLVERGVRFVQLFHGDVQPWDSHANLPTQHRDLARQCDQGIAALLTDLKQRGLFEDTLVLCGGEFGRTPSVELVKGKPGHGRDHNHWGFSVWLAGGGIKGGHIHGATDEFGYKAVESPVHVHDLHATILHLLGFDHTKLTYRHAGRDFRLTDVHGEVVHPILA